MVILTAKNPRLRQVAKAVVPSPETTKLIQVLIDTVEKQHNPEGVGLAAPQIGSLQRIFVAKMTNKFVPFFNPIIVKKSEREEIAIEGCLSVPDLYGEVRRPYAITVRYLNRFGKTVLHEYHGISARIIQHETDHLEGILFLDHLKRQGGKLYRYQGKDEGGNELYQLL